MGVAATPRVWVVPDLVFAVMNEILALPDPVLVDALDELTTALEELRAQLTTS